MRALVLGFVGGLLACLLVVAAVGVGVLRYRAAAPARERAALLADLDAYTAWYQREQWRRNLNLPSFERDRDGFIVQRPRLERYARWWQQTRRARPNGGSVYELAITNALRPEDLRDDAMLDAYLRR